MATLIATHFLQLAGESALTSLILTYAAFAITFFFRSLGTVLSGRLGDRYGRKPVLIAILILMTLTTALRVLQGLFAGGEYGGAVSLMTEFAPPGKRGFYRAWQSLTVTLGLLAGAGVVATLPLGLDEDTMQAWGWRISCLLTQPLGAVAC